MGFNYWWRSSKRKLKRASPPRRTNHARLRLERLEERRLPTTLLVNNPTDSDTCV